MENTVEVHSVDEEGWISATIDGVLYNVPGDMSNRHRQIIAEWEALGNVLPDPVAPVEAVPFLISDRQFFQELAVRGVITQAEALAAVATGTIPAAMEDLINLLPSEQQFPARMLIAGATTFERGHAVTSLIGALYNWDDEEIDQLWRDASVL